VHDQPRRRLLFGVLCFIAGWTAAGFAEFYRLPVLADVGLLLLALLAIAWVSDRTGG
jgi:TM2 domain-containing membrane protein YozV